MNDCERKIAYNRKKDAKKAVGRCGAYEVRQLHVYRCPSCRQWHIGHRTKA
jgi:lipopolysaccharide biosynthesis regulator YciM